MIRNDANSILLFPVDLAIRRVQETQMLILECHQSACILYPFMKCSALALFGLFIHFFHQGCLDRGQRCDAGLDRDCAVCWLHKWFQGLQVCVCHHCHPPSPHFPPPLHPPVFVCSYCCYLHFNLIPYSARTDSLESVPMMQLFD